MNQMNGLTDLRAHGQPRTEAEDAHQHRELLPVRPQEAGPVVHEAGHQGLHVAELRVNPKDLEDKDIKDLRSITGQRLVGHQQHDEEDGRPEEGGWEGEDELWVGEEHEAGPGPGHGVRLGAAGGRPPDHRGDGEAVDGGHVAEDREHEEPGGEAGAGVHHAGDQRVPVAVVVELVVRPQGGQRAGPHAANIFGMCLNIFAAPVGEEYLRGAVYPGGAPEQVVPLRGDVVQQPRPGPLQREGAPWELGIAVVTGKY